MTSTHGVARRVAFAALATIVVARGDGGAREYDLKYYDLITKTGWPAETRGVRNPYGGMTFPLEAR